jgi:hypothetical protein
MKKLLVMIFLAAAPAMTLANANISSDGISMFISNERQVSRSIMQAHIKEHVINPIIGLDVTTEYEMQVNCVANLIRSKTERTWDDWTGYEKQGITARTVSFLCSLLN